MVQTKVFFFASRRRHTRLVSDWSSDVCSSGSESAEEECINFLPRFATTTCTASETRKEVDTFLLGAFGSVATRRKIIRLAPSPVALLAGAPRSEALLLPALADPSTRDRHASLLHEDAPARGVKTRRKNLCPR